MVLPLAPDARAAPPRAEAADPSKLTQANACQTEVRLGLFRGSPMRVPGGACTCRSAATVINGFCFYIVGLSFTQAVGAAAPPAQPSCLSRGRTGCSAAARAATRSSSPVARTDAVRRPR
jgi:hypothetical protein